jgi:hypothetical protein
LGSRESPMAFHQEQFLSLDQLTEVLSYFAPEQQIDVLRYRGAITMSTNELRDFIFSSYEEGHQAGGDLEVLVPIIKKRLIGHHDGVYWLEDLEA